MKSRRTSTSQENSHTPNSDPCGGDLSTAIVIPTYNEAENIHAVVDGIFKLNIPNPIVVIVDDGSPDGTAKIAEMLSRQYDGKVHLIQRGEKLGLGTAYVTGFSYALSHGSDYILQMDADMSHGLEYIPEFINKLRVSDVVVGSRYVIGGGIDLRSNMPRKMLSSLANFGIRTTVGLKVKDSTSGFKAFRKDVLKSIDLSNFKCSGFGFQVEVAYACERKNFRVLEHPIIFTNRLNGKSKMSIAIIFEAIRHLLLIRWDKKS